MPPMIGFSIGVVAGRRRGANQAPPGSPISTKDPVIAASNGGTHPSTLSVTSVATFTNNPTERSYQWVKNGAPYGAETATPQNTNTDGPGSYKLTERATNAAGANYANSNTLQIAAAAVAGSVVQNYVLGAVTTSTIDYAFDAPATGTAPFTYRVEYRLTSSSGAWTVFAASQAATSGTVTGLATETSYSIRITPLNAAGDGAPTSKSKSTAAAVATAPAQMAAPSLTQSPGTIAVTRAADPANGGSAITGFDLRYGTDGTNWTVVAMTTNPQSIAGLTNGTAYLVQTRAVNAIGAGAYSASATITPTAAASAVFTDDFNRADTTDVSTDGSGKWTRVSGLASGLRIVSNQATTAANEGGYRAEMDLGSNDMAIEFNIPGNTASVGPFMCLRFIDQNNFVGVRYNGSTKALQVWKRVAGTLSQITGGSFTSNGDLIRVEAVGGDVKLLVNGSVVGSSATQTDLVASNYAGITPRGTAHSPCLDNFKAQAITALTA